MRPVSSLLAYLGLVFFGGALLAPWLYWGVETLSIVFSFQWLRSLAGNPFHRYVDRSLLLLAFLGLLPFLRSLGVRSWRDVGLVKLSGQWSNLGRGFALGVTSLAGVAIAVLAAGARAVNGDVSIGRFAGKLAAALITAGVVAVLEEVLFRGALFGALRKSFRWKAAMVISSAVYAVVHFFNRPEPPSEINWASGLTVLPMMLQGFIDKERLIPGFFNLTLAGVLLALAYQRSGNLYFSIGLHAGWILWLKTYGFLTHETTEANAWFWGTGKMIDGWLAPVVMTPVLLLLPKLLSCEPSDESG